MKLTEIFALHEATNPNMNKVREQFIRDILEDLASEDTNYEGEFEKEFKFIQKGPHPRASIQFQFGHVVVGFVTDHEIDVMIFDQHKSDAYKNLTIDIRDEPQDWGALAGKIDPNLTKAQRDSLGKAEDKAEEIQIWIDEYASQINYKYHNSNKNHSIVHDYDSTGSEESPRRETQYTVLKRLVDGESLSDKDMRLLAREGAIYQWSLKTKKRWPNKAEEDKVWVNNEFVGIAYAALFGIRFKGLEEHILKVTKANLEYVTKHSLKITDTYTKSIFDYIEKVIKRPWKEAEEILKPYPTVLAKYTKLVSRLD